MTHSVLLGGGKRALRSAEIGAAVVQHQIGCALRLNSGIVCFLKGFIGFVFEAVNAVLLIVIGAGILIPVALFVKIGLHRLLLGDYVLKHGVGFVQLLLLQIVQLLSVGRPLLRLRRYARLVVRNALCRMRGGFILIDLTHLRTLYGKLGGKHYGYILAGMLVIHEFFYLK